MGSVLGSSDPAVTISLGVEKKTIDSEPANSFALTVRQANEAARSNCDELLERSDIPANPGKQGSRTWK